MTTYIRLNQIRKADVFDDTLSQAAIAAIEGTAVDDEDFLGGQLSQIKRMVGGTDWYSAIESVTADPRSLKTITDNIYYKTVLRRRSVLTDVTVGGADNWVVLSVASSEAPSETAAVGAGSASGAVVALLAGASGSHSLNEVGGLNPITPKNLVLVRDAVSFDPILDSAGREIYGLLQAESIVVDGDAFDDTTRQAQISFVVQNAAGNDLVAASAADIQGKVINYSYVSREKLHALNEQDFLNGMFQDPQSAQTNTLQQAYVGGNTISVLTAEGNLIFDLSQDLTEFRVQRGGASFAYFKRDDTVGDSLTLDLDILDVNNSTDADFLNGAKFDTGGTTINVGVVAGQVDATAIVVRATTGDVTIHSNSGEARYRDVRETTPLPFTDATAGAISALPGGPYLSISAAIRAALTASDLDFYVQTLANNYAQDANVPGATETWAPALDLSARSIDMTAANIATLDTLVFLNGRLLQGGNGTTNNDVYKGTTPANGDLKYDFTKGVKAGDVVLAMSWKNG